jgi:hypothetical protein
MSERPTAQELTEALMEFLAGELLPTLTDHRLRFRTLVAMNALSIVYRELEALPPPDDRQERALVERIRGGELPVAEVKALLEEKLRIASPRTLEAYGE